VVGLLLASIIRFARTSLDAPLAWTLAVVAFAAGTLLTVHAALIVVVAGALGVFLHCLGGRGVQREQGGRQ
jgi:chromate transport protein ChrA